MSELEDLLNDIERLRSSLYKLINEKNIDLINPEIVAASELLNSTIVKYIEIINKKGNK